MVTTLMIFMAPMIMRFFVFSSTGIGEMRTGIDHVKISQILLFWGSAVSFFFFNCSGFCHTLKWNSHGFTCVPHPDPPSHLPVHPIPLGLSWLYSLWIIASLGLILSFEKRGVLFLFFSFLPMFLLLLWKSKVSEDLTLPFQKQFHYNWFCI